MPLRRSMSIRRSMLSRRRRWTGHVNDDFFGLQGYKKGHPHFVPWEEF